MHLTSTCLPVCLPIISCPPFSPSPFSIALPGLRLRPGLALSHDGFNWARIEGPHHSGALFDVQTFADFAAADTDSVSDPATIPPSVPTGALAPYVVFHAPRDLRLFSSFFDPTRRRFRLSLSRSSDGLRWEPQGHVFSGSKGEGAQAFDARGIASCAVIRDPTAHPDEDGAGYWMFYEGVAEDGRSSIGLARSADGLFAWQVVGAVLHAAEDGTAWDRSSVGAPSVVLLPGGRIRLYYLGRDGCGGQGIGAAEADVSDLQFRRVNVLGVVGGEEAVGGEDGKRQ